MKRLRLLESGITVCGGAPGHRLAIDPYCLPHQRVLDLLARRHTHLRQ